MTDSTRGVSDELVHRLRAAGCVFAEDEAALLIDAATTSEELQRLVNLRVAGEPLEHLLGWVEFDGLRLTVRPGVFVPRKRSEALVDAAATALGLGAARPRGSPSRCVVVDLCCGCGAIGTALAARAARRDVPIAVHAADIDPAATACATTNLAPFGGQVYTGDLYEALPETLKGAVDVIVANVPYVPSRAVALMPSEARNHEPRLALDGGGDGLMVARRLVAPASTWLAPGGVVMLECDHTQATTAVDAVRRAGLRAAVRTDDDREVTIVTGTRESGRRTA